MILVREDLEFELKALNADCEGRYILLEAVVQGSNYTFVNIYAPNKVQQQSVFFRNLNDALDLFCGDFEKKIIIGGDFNVTFDPNLDCSGGTPAKKDSVKCIQDMCLDYDVIDIWSEKPRHKTFYLGDNESRSFKEG